MPAEFPDGVRSYRMDFGPIVRYSPDFQRSNLPLEVRVNQANIQALAAEGGVSPEYLGSVTLKVDLLKNRLPSSSAPFFDMDRRTRVIGFYPDYFLPGADIQSSDTLSYAMASGVSDINEGAVGLEFLKRVKVLSGYDNPVRSRYAFLVKSSLYTVIGLAFGVGVAKLANGTDVWDIEKQLGLFAGASFVAGMGDRLIDKVNQTREAKEYLQFIAPLIEDPRIADLIRLTPRAS